jgi:hypothetical protein
VGPYYDFISLFLWRGRHPLGTRASVKTRAAAGDRSRRASPHPDLQNSSSVRQTFLELIRKLMDLGVGGELSAPGRSEVGAADARSKQGDR